MGPPSGSFQVQLSLHLFCQNRKCVHLHKKKKKSFDFGWFCIGVPKMVYNFKYLNLRKTFSATSQSGIFQFFALKTKASLFSANGFMSKMPQYVFLVKPVLYKIVCVKRCCVPQALCALQLHSEQYL